MPRGSHAPQRTRRAQSGFTYVALLVAVVVIGLGLAATGHVWSQTAQREKEEELLFVGNQFRQAIERYVLESPGTPRYPQRLEDLLADRRHVTVKRYLRRIYRDPMTGRAEWGLVRAPDGGIMGVHSLSEKAPIKTDNFPARDAALKGRTRYADWHFTYEAMLAVEGAPFAPPGASSPEPPPTVPPGIQPAGGS